MPSTNEENAELTAVVLNDTSYSNHHGCRVVMRSLLSGLRDVGIKVTATAPVGTPWWLTPNFMEHCFGCDVIIINGEGTIHHGAHAAENLLKITEAASVYKIPVCLINTIYQDNPEMWGNYLRKLSYVSVRDSASFDHCRDLFPDTRFCADIALISAPQPMAKIKKKYSFCDSVVKETSQAIEHLYKIYRDHAYYIPIRTLKKNIGDDIEIAQRATNYRFEKKYAIQHLIDPNRLLFDEHEAYCKCLSSTQLHVTGRFHSACFAIAAGVPFVAIESNAYKIQALTYDIGLSPRRLASSISRSEIDDIPSWIFSDAEMLAIKTFLADHRQRFLDMMTDIKAIASGKKS